LTNGKHPGPGFTAPLTSAIILLLLTLLLAGCEDQARMVETTDLPDDLPDQELFDTSIYDSREGVRRWRLDSERLARYHDQDEAQLYGVHMEFYRADTLFSTLTAERGRANLKTNDLFTWGDVVVVTQDGRRLETEELYYDERNGLISNDVFNRFTRGDNVMTGIGMEATPELDRFELKQTVAATVYDEPGDTGKDAP